MPKCIKIMKEKGSGVKLDKRNSRELMAKTRVTHLLTHSAGEDVAC